MKVTKLLLTLLSLTHFTVEAYSISDLGEWKTSIKYNKQHQYNVTLLLNAKSNSYGDDHTTMLVIQCREGKTHAYIAWDELTDGLMTKVKYRFDENSISKARFDIQVLENSKAYYLDKVLAKFNLDAHRTFNEADSPYGYLEFSFIEIKEHNRISKTDKFTKLENENMEQKIILNCIKHQLRFMKYKTLIVVIYNIFKVITKNIIKRIVYGK